MCKWEIDYDWPGAEADFKRAIELNPNDSMVRYWYALFFSAVGRFEEALAEANLARSLDPVSPVTNTYLAWIHYYAGEYDEAIELCRKTLDLEPVLHLTHTLI